MDMPVCEPFFQRRAGTVDIEDNVAAALLNRARREDFLLSTFLASKTEGVYALLRVVAGLLFAFHGVQLVFGVLTNTRPPVASQIWIGGVLELVTGLLIAAGFLTRWAAFVASGTMAVAYVQFHWKLRFDANFFPAVNQGELALLNAILFLFIACYGAERFSLDRALAGRPAAPPPGPLRSA
jgi:putative oxidoreductase